MQLKADIGVIIMDEYRKPYFILWRGIDEALAAMQEQNYVWAVNVLIKAQQAAEDAYIEENESAVIVKHDFRPVP